MQSSACRNIGARSKLVWAQPQQRTTMSHTYIAKALQKKEAMHGENFRLGIKLCHLKIYRLEKN
jgi:hypothetical protein